MIRPPTETDPNDRTLWRTPPVLVAAVLDRLRSGRPFDLDAAAAGPETAHGFRCLTPAEDALAPGAWGPRCFPKDAPGELRSAWLNPPFGRGGVTARWTDRAIVEADGLALLCVLVPEATDTGWWRRLYARADEALSLGRVPFLRPDGSPGDSPPQGYSLMVLRGLRPTRGASLRPWAWK